MFNDVRRGVIVVAHPDDESLWCGGLVLRYPGVWSIIACSIPRADPIRAWKFYEACKRLGVYRAQVLPVIEPPANESFSHLAMLDLAEFDCIVTHNSRGEYGHKQHSSLHHDLVARWPEKVVTIGYGSGRPGDEVIALTPEECSRKRIALQAYDHISPTDGKPKWDALIARYGGMFDLDVETYDRHRA